MIFVRLCDWNLVLNLALHPTEKGKLTSILNKLSENWFYIVNLYISVHIFNTLWLAVLSYRPFSFGKTGKIVIATTFIACLYMWLLNHPSDHHPSRRREVPAAESG